MTTARLARPDRAGHGRWAGHGGDHAHSRCQQDRRLALAGLVHGRGRAGSAARQDAVGAVAKLADEVAERIVALTLGEPPGGTTLDRPGDG